MPAHERLVGGHIPSHFEENYCTFVATVSGHNRTDYSVLNASTGSSRIARRAGIKHAMVVTMARRAESKINVTGSVGLTPTSTLARTRLRPQDPNKPRV